MPLLPHFGYNENFPFKCKSITLKHFSMPAGSKLRDRKSQIAIHFLKFSIYEDLKPFAI